MKKLISALLAVLLLAAPVLAADEPDTLAARFDALRAEYHLDETNFAVSYYNTVTGEEYNWNETAMFTAASTFKLPLNLYYYELQNEGKISGRHRPHRGRRDARPLPLSQPRRVKQRAVHRHALPHRRFPDV